MRRTIAPFQLSFCSAIDDARGITVNVVYFQVVLVRETAIPLFDRHLFQQRIVLNFFDLWYTIFGIKIDFISEQIPYCLPGISKATTRPNSTGISLLADGSRTANLPASVCTANYL